MNDEQRSLHRDLVALEGEINEQLMRSSFERGAVRLLWQVSAVSPGRMGGYSAKRTDSLSEAVIEIDSPTVAGLAKLIQRVDLGAQAQAADLQLHNADNWRVLNDELQGSRRLVEHLRARVAELEGLAA